MSHARPKGSGKARVALRIMATSDVHATLLDYDYSKDKATALGSLARAATVIEEARVDGPTTLVFDNGDFLEGAAIADPHEGGAGVGVDNPVVAAMNRLGYDAIGLGNHEFNLPAEHVQAALQALEAPILCANLHLSRRQDAAVYANLWQSHVVLTRSLMDQHGRMHDLRIGVFSVLPPQVVAWDAMRIAGRLVAEDILSAARRQVADLRSQGVNVVVALAHTGIGELDRAEETENVAAPLAGLLGVDAVVAGHVHRVFPSPSFGVTDTIDPVRGTLHGTPVVMPGRYANHVGQIDLSLQPDDQGWQVVEHEVQVHELSGETAPVESPTIVSAVEDAHQHTLRYMRRTIGALTEPVTSYFSMVKDDCASRLVAEAKLAFARSVLAGSGLEAMPLIASIAPLKCGGRAGPGHYVDVAPGEVSARVVADMQPYSNHVSIIQTCGRDVVEWLEKGCAVYNQLFAGEQEQFLYDRDALTYNREAIYGLSYTVDLSQPARYGMDGSLINPQARRVGNICWRGVQIAPEQEFLLVTNDYRGGGGGNFPAVAQGHVVEIAPARVRDVLAQHIAETSGRRDEALATWRLQAIPGVKALFDTGPGAVKYVDLVTLPLRHLGEVDGGFARFELDMGQL
ncbi:MAG: bifunctional 2',3'-cyclic-nucleotide 2'-phosphodiesterase/3'-nucleotidase [Shimia sp.]|uniref:bifunctional 2',3'-cyclic-nucleotide 2'-phosphodiesterase/3'-nucleotidase n=1 Tax=Shimia sp. TaxID=1954381 RepID=UPI001B2C07A4|nr:bifunctional 2',3'-cyclic-nucleotide 2'-phosphodiesterase/3'-nucleotidase [Shimia sp.]MBO6897833.1 bifunctional 2',3'-cyclic-nucleotide 2'-phosphodiesterase/3'-nucleotidase [Shimia sp.]